ncbi:MAG: DUF433 domain-containing protein [Planctomycetia bacterium]|nr:DUF433 domain-containing protein [Planctomycetia bacterium]
MQPAAIINRGRGPEIEGTRITVYTIMDFLKMGWHHTRIASFLRISSDQVLAATRYIEEHQEEVTAAYERILERSANAKNSPEVEAIRVKGRAKLLALQEEIRQAKSLEHGHARNGSGS